MVGFCHFSSSKKTAELMQFPQGFSLVDVFFLSLFLAIDVIGIDITNFLFWSTKVGGYEELAARFEPSRNGELFLNKIIIMQISRIM